MAEHPIRLVVTDDLQRSRLTVFFRYLLAVPHWFVLMLWGIVVYLVYIVNWFATLFAGQSPQGLHNFTANYLRYNTRVSAYVYLLANPFPPFSGDGSYPVDLEVAPPAKQSRAKTFFRFLLAIPALLLAYVLGAVLGMVGFLSWFACLFLGRNPQGLQNLGCYCLSYMSQTNAYAFLLTDRYPALGSPTG